jgi:hypothetical protein
MLSRSITKNIWRKVSHWNFYGHFIMERHLYGIINKSGTKGNQTASYPKTGTSLFSKIMILGDYDFERIYSHLEKFQTKAFIKSEEL